MAGTCTAVSSPPMVSPSTARCRRCATCLITAADWSRWTMTSSSRWTPPSRRRRSPDSLPPSLSTWCVGLRVQTLAKPIRNNSSLLCVCVFQTVQSEGSLSEEGGTKLNISRAVWVQSQQVNQTAEGQLGGGVSGWSQGWVESEWVESVGDDVAICWWSLGASSFRAAAQHLGRHKESGCGQRRRAQPHCPPASANHSPAPNDQW